MVIGDFVEKSKNIHGNRYDYSSIRVLSNTKKVEVVCVDHGIFSISPYLHISGIGCSKCAGNRKLTTGEFIKLSQIRDSIKNIYCLNNNINLIIIKYTDDEVKQKICSLLYAS
jgi:hypothetical protein